MTMARIQPIQQNELSPSVAVAFERHTDNYSGIFTNMKGTLGHSLQSFELYMQWYPMYESVEKILGRRLAYLFGYSISCASACTLCTAFFRKKIIDAGEDPQNLLLSPSQRNVMDFGSSIARHHGHIADHIYNEIAKSYETRDIVTLVAFAGQMIAANIFNNVVETEVDDHLLSYVPPVKYC